MTTRGIDRDHPFVLSSGQVRTCGLCGSRLKEGLLSVVWQEHHDAAHSAEAYQRLVDQQKKLAPSGKRHLRVVK